MRRHPSSGSLKVAGMIADGEPIDWADAAEDPDVAGCREGFRILEAVAETHRRVARDEAEAERVQQGASGEADGSAATESRDAGRAGTTAVSPADQGTIPLLSAGSTWGSFEIRGFLGRGGFGEVYRAWDPNLQRDVALKLLRPDRASDGSAVDCFLNEAQRHARVSHEHVVTIHGAGVHDGRAGMWMDFVQGRTLEQILQNDGRFSAEEAISIGIQMCRALAAVHAEGLVHRDVKTGNIMRQEGGGHLLMDFSACSESSGARSGRGHEPAAGTLLFMAPDLLEGASADPRADIYSLGVVLYRLVTARFPVTARSLDELREKHRRGESVPLHQARAGLPHEFVHLVERALAQEPEIRFRTATEMEEALLGLPPYPTPRPSDPVPVPPIPWWIRLRRSRFARWAVPAAALLVVWLGLAWIPSWLGRGLEVEAALYRLGPAVSQKLKPGDLIRPGEQIFLELSGNREMYVYILSEDPVDGASVVYPLDYLDTQNPLAPDVLHRLPGTVEGEEGYWDLDAKGDRQSLYVVASTGRLDALEEAMKSSNRAARTPTSPANGAKSGSTLKGITSISPPATVPKASGAMVRTFRSIATAGSSDPGLWTWEIDLSTPATKGSGEVENR